MTRDGLYHKDIRLPKNIQFPRVEVVLNYTYHALEASRRDRNGAIKLPETLLFAHTELVEVEIVNGQAYKVVVRIHHDNRNDLALVILLNGMRVKTVWLNRKNDNHRTLDKSKYMK